MPIFYLGSGVLSEYSMLGCQLISSFILFSQNLDLCFDSVTADDVCF